MQSQNRSWLVLALFFCSGATALVYEVIWSKFLSQMFGSTIYAQTAVLAAFMGGLALGNKIFGGRADRTLRPVRAYGLLEIAIGVYAFVFPWVDRAVDQVFISLGARLIDSAGWLFLLKTVLAAAMLLGPTILMGGTLPLMAAWLQKSAAGDAGRRSARFYSVNSLGAVCGSALAGFFLVQKFGMITTLYLTAAVNIAIGVVAMLAGRAISTEDQAARSALPSSTLHPPSSLCYAGLIVALAGAVSMGLEVLASRSLALIFGSSLQSFAVVLITFILGIGLGSAWIASPSRRIRLNEAMVVALLCAAAAWVAILVLNIERWVDFYRIARTGLARTEAGYIYHQLLTVGISLVVLGVPAACIGAVLPLMIRAVSGEGKLLGQRVGALLTWNTLGCVGGVLLTGFFLMPTFGLRNAFGTLALALALMALLLALRRRMRIGLAGAVVAAGLAGSLFIQDDMGWKNVLSSGVFRLWETKFDPNLMPARRRQVKTIFYEDGADATVTVAKTDVRFEQASIGMSINGKTEASMSDLTTQFLCSHLAMLAKPGAKDVFVLGLASGMTAAAPLDYPIERLDVAENCEPVIKASHCFDDWNRNVLSDPRTHLWIEDGRTVLKLRPQLYDVIITQPSNPWFVGTGSVFSKEYYEVTASRLKPGGIVAQWVQLYETQDDIVELVLRTFGSVFPYMEIWDSGGGDMLLLGSLQPWQTGPDVFRKGFQYERARLDLEMINILSPEMLMARQLASQQTAFAIAGPGPMQSDHYPVLEYIAPKAFYLGGGSQVLSWFDERTHQQLLAPPEKRAILRSIPVAQSQRIFDEQSTVSQQFWDCIFGQPSAANVPCALPTPNLAPPPAVDGNALNLCSMAISQGNWAGAQQFALHALAQDPNNRAANYLKRIVDRKLGGRY